MRSTRKATKREPAPDPKRSPAPSPRPVPVSADPEVSDRRRLSGQETRERILHAAEELFAEKGFEGVGLRDIIKKAGVNSAAIHYHFGSKEALILSVFYERAKPIADSRMARLAELRARGPIVLEELIGAFLRPAVYDERGGQRVRSTYAAIRLALSVSHKAQLRAAQAEVFNESTHQYLAAFKECLPDLSEREIYFRFDFLLGLMLHAMANIGRVTELSSGAADPTDPEVVLTELIPFVAAGMRGAPPAAKD
ncbi:TetR/AcrR family transcriptional regulator [Acuticoccus kandeliae]|uniref:TetR/AcrR family transcriptional regulator n=1 Tax=Acuticoccus kandeliae TaxID=2073160 RepID=UPI00196A3C37|nr:TetR/AcrR family transcriptional regulator [Acuticoccus kandeliae]